MCRTRPERVLQHESRQPSFVHGCGDGPAWGALGLRDEARAPAGLQNRRVKGCLWCTKGADVGQGHAAASAGHSGAKTQEGACFYGGGCLGRKTRRAQKHTGNWSEMAPLGAPGPIFRVKTGSKVHGVKPTILVRFRKKNCVRVRKVWGPHMGTVGPRNSDLQKSAPGGRLASALGARRTYGGAWRPLGHCRRALPLRYGIFWYLRPLAKGALQRGEFFSSFSLSPKI